MDWNPKRLLLTFFLVILLGIAHIAAGKDRHGGHDWKHDNQRLIQLGPRPYYLIEDMDTETNDQIQLKNELQECSDRPIAPIDFSIGHRGASLQFPEHTKESYVAAARTGAGIIECDATFTSDRELVCRHSQCDLHTTTNILAIPELAAKCSEPFTPAAFDASGTLTYYANCMGFGLDHHHHK